MFVSSFIDVFVLAVLASPSSTPVPDHPTGVVRFSHLLRTPRNRSDSTVKRPPGIRPFPLAPFSTASPSASAQVLDTTSSTKRKASSPLPTTRILRPRPTIPTSFEPQTVTGMSKSSDVVVIKTEPSILPSTSHRSSSVKPVVLLTKQEHSLVSVKASASSKVPSSAISRGVTPSSSVKPERSSHKDKAPLSSSVRGSKGFHQPEASPPPAISADFAPTVTTHPLAKPGPEDADAITSDDCPNPDIGRPPVRVYLLFF